MGLFGGGSSQSLQLWEGLLEITPTVPKDVLRTFYFLPSLKPDGCTRVRFVNVSWSQRGLHPLLVYEADPRGLCDICIDEQRL